MVTAERSALLVSFLMDDEEVNVPIGADVSDQKAAAAMVESVLRAWFLIDVSQLS